MDDAAQILPEKQGSTVTATYTYGNTLIRKDGETPLFDGLGSERTVTNSSQTVTGTLTQDGFGNYVTSTGSSSNPYMFAATSGYRNDNDAGLSHVGARYYDAQVGRFISRDTDLSQIPYLYCEHDPVNYTDPDGHLPEWMKRTGDGLGRLWGKIGGLLKGGAKAIGIATGIAGIVGLGSSIYNRIIEANGKEAQRRMYRDWITKGGYDDGSVLDLIYPKPRDVKNVGNTAADAYRQTLP